MRPGGGGLLPGAHPLRTHSINYAIDEQQPLRQRIFFNGEIDGPRQITDGLAPQDLPLFAAARPICRLPELSSRFVSLQSSSASTTVSGSASISPSRSVALTVTSSVTPSGTISASLSVAATRTASMTMSTSTSPSISASASVSTSPTTAVSISPTATPVSNCKFPLNQLPLFHTTALCISCLMRSTLRVALLGASPITAGPPGFVAEQGGFCYTAIFNGGAGLSWPDAQAQCTALGGLKANLATIRDAPQKQAVIDNRCAGLVPQGYFWWIGMHDQHKEGNYQFASGYDPSYALSTNLFCPGEVGCCS